MSAASIKRDWEGETVAIFASGPSMNRDIADEIRVTTTKVIAINNQAIDCAPWADVIWGSDFKWWKEHYPAVKDHPGRKFHVLQSQTHEGVETLLQGTPVFDDRPTHISCGGNSGYAALCLAVKLGAARVMLYGYDMRAVNGRMRRFEYSANLNSKPRFQHWIPKFDALSIELMTKRGVDVVNCTPGSALRCFPFSAQAVRHVA